MSHDLNEGDSGREKVVKRVERLPRTRDDSSDDDDNDVAGVTGVLVCVIKLCHTPSCRSSVSGCGPSAICSSWVPPSPLPSSRTNVPPH